MVVIGLATIEAAPVSAQTAAYNRADVVSGLCSGETSSTTQAIDALLAEVASKREAADWAATIVSALGTKRLLCSKNGVLLLETEAGHLDPVTMSPVTIDGKLPKAPFVNLKVRANLNVAASLLSLLENPASPDADDAVDILEKRYENVDSTVLAVVLNGVVDSDLRDRLKVVQSLKILQSDDVVDVDKRIQAIEVIADVPTERNRTALINLQQRDDFKDSDPRLVRALEAAIDDVGTWIQIGNIGAVLFSGMSYASILFMASLGLAIIFGLMGVINLAQGEFIMVGSYATFMVQEVIRLWVPGLLDWYLLIAIPIAFLVTAAVGMILEATVIRHLYGRPLMTLLATWAISLFLINLVRVAFGTQNLEFIVPSFLSGGVRVTADFIVTWSRLFAIGFSVAVLISVLLLVHKTRWGLYIRGVTENRAMASCVGVSSRRVDSISFGFGSGLAGLAGLVLTPIYNVNPTMGTNFIVDSFMVVVLGGVGNVAGTLISALAIGQINIVIEPIYGAVAAKVIVLLMIIVFIQFRPQGIFAVKGRK